MPGHHERVGPAEFNSLIPRVPHIARTTERVIVSLT